MKHNCIEHNISEWVLICNVFPFCLHVNRVYWLATSAPEIVLYGKNQSTNDHGRELNQCNTWKLIFFSLLLLSSVNSFEMLFRCFTFTINFSYHKHIHIHTYQTHLKFLYHINHILLHNILFSAPYLYYFIKPLWFKIPYKIGSETEQIVIYQYNIPFRSIKKWSILTTLSPSYNIPRSLCLYL
jgi:hypothetical protein